MDTAFLRRCIATLEFTLREMEEVDGADDVLGDIHRAACVRYFELVLEQGGKLLRKRLAAFFASNRRADELAFRDLFRHAAKHGLLDADAAERWLAYRDNRDDDAHDHGERFSETTLQLLPGFVADAKALADMVGEGADAPTAGRLHLDAGHRRLLEALLREHLPGIEAWAYGSRVTGRSHDGSDLDLVLRGPGLGRIPDDRMRAFEEAVGTSAIPILVEARDWAFLPERFHREIEKAYVVLGGDMVDET